MRFTRTTVAAAATAVAATLALGQLPAYAASQMGPATSFTLQVSQTGAVTTPTEGDAIPNVDSVKATIRAYYGATKGTNPANPSGAQIYLPNLTTSAYAKNTEAIAEDILAALDTTAPADAAVVFDVDSTLLSDYGNEEEMNYIYDSTKNAAWVTGRLFPAVPGMVDLVTTLKTEGYAIYAITGRPASQEADTIANLTEAGFVDGTTAIFDADNTYTKDVTNQSWVDCTVDGDATCSTVEYKALTRKHIEDTDAKDIVLAVGDQWSDLQGGYADDTQKIPNPTYYLPSANIPGAPDGDAAMVLPTTYTMAPDGSTGATLTDGDAIPNIGPVFTAIRAYYGATKVDGVYTASTTSSPFLTQMAALEAVWTPAVVSACQTGAAKVAAAADAIAYAATLLKPVKKAVKKAKKALKTAKKSHVKSRIKKAKKKLKKAKRKLVHVQNVVASMNLPRTPAAVFDADDTTLWNYDMEDGAMGFNYDSSLADQWIQAQKTPAIPGMPALVQAAAAAGCTIVGLTGRSAYNQDATIGNLTKVGYVSATGAPLFTADNYYTKPTPVPSYIDCGDDAKCSTIEFKAGTRQYIEEVKGLDIVANFGDQYSDLHGGYADATYKLPNPMYYLS
ncbi:HAD family acid phosphatase [Nocardioides sp.]|uniref:HAD family acid phosphatase n=1 Tax=Nocardioides sp. TaxID=35761 RepID=UPI0039E4F78A